MCTMNANQFIIVRVLTQKLLHNAFKFIDNVIGRHMMSSGEEFCILYCSWKLLWSIVPLGTCQIHNKSQLFILLLYLTDKVGG